MKLKVLQHQQEQLAAEGKALTMIAAEKRTSEQQGRLAALTREGGELDWITKEVKAEQGRVDEERRMIAGLDDARHHGRTWRARGPRFAEMFPDVPLSSDGFSSVDEWFRVVHSGLFHPNLKAAGSEGIGPAGGYAVPPEYAAMMLDRSLEREIVRPRATIIPMVADRKLVPGWDDLDHSGGSLFGGFKAAWLPEAGPAVDQDYKLRMIEMKTRKLALFTKVSNELIADGVGFEQALGEAMITATGWNLDDAFLNGPGVGQPLGVLNDPALIVIAKETNQAAASILYDNLVKMFARMHPALVGESVWVANTATIPQLLTLSMAVGTGGSHIPVLQPSSAPGVDFTILTRPVVFTEKLPTLGTKGDILFAAFSAYFIGMRKEVSVEKSMHVGWSTDESGYRAILRADGMGSWNKPATPKNGDTLSWAVTLATRA
jgi:HK97 family phage major capsid protein